MLTVTNGDGSTSTAAFTVNAKPTITSFSPASLGQGATSQTVTMVGTLFSSGPPLGATVSGSGITVNSTTVTDSTHISLNLSLTGGATTGPRTVTLTNGDGGVATSTAFTVNAAPMIHSLTPNNLGQGATRRPVAIAGTGFSNSALLDASVSGAGVTVNSLTFNSTTSLTANISVDGAAASGARTLTLTNGDGGTSIGTTFTVNAAPTVTSLEPLERGAGRDQPGCHGERHELRRRHLGAFVGVVLGRRDHGELGDPIGATALSVSVTIAGAATTAPVT